MRRRLALVVQAIIPAIRAMTATAPIRTHSQVGTELDVPVVGVGEGEAGAVVAAGVVAAGVVAAGVVASQFLGLLWGDQAPPGQLLPVTLPPEIQYLLARPDDHGRYRAG